MRIASVLPRDFLLQCSKLLLKSRSLGSSEGLPSWQNIFKMTSLAFPKTNMGYSNKMIKTCTVSVALDSGWVQQSSWNSTYVPSYWKHITMTIHKWKTTWPFCVTMAVVIKLVLSCSFGGRKSWDLGIWIFLGGRWISVLSGRIDVMWSLGPAITNSDFEYPKFVSGRLCYKPIATIRSLFFSILDMWAFDRQTFL